MEFFLILSKDPDYNELEDWAFNQVESGLSPLICNKQEIKKNFDTLIDRILMEGICLYGMELNAYLKENPREIKEPETDLLDLVRSL